MGKQAETFELKKGNMCDPRLALVLAHEVFLVVLMVSDVFERMYVVLEAES